MKKRNKNNKRVTSTCATWHATYCVLDEYKNSPSKLVSIQFNRINGRPNKMALLTFHVPLAFTVVSVATIIFQLFWKYLHVCIPKMPYRSVWANYLLSLCQVALIGVLIFHGWDYNTSESQENGYEFEKFEEYAIHEEKKFNTVRKEVSEVKYPIFPHVTKEMPNELFLIKTRHDALKMVDSKNIKRASQFTEFAGQECSTAKKLLTDLDKKSFHLFAPFNQSLEESIVNWNNVIAQQKEKIKAPMEVENVRFGKHVARTRRMAEDSVMYWSSARVLLRSYMLALTQHENEMFVLIYTTPLIVCLFQCFWATVCSTLFTHIPLDAMWRIIMKWLLYIGSTLAIVLALYQIYLGNTTPACQPIQNEFHKVMIPSYAADSNINSQKFFDNCAMNGQTVFDASRETILITRSHVASNVSLALRNISGPIFARIPELDEIVVKRAKSVFIVVAQMKSIVKSCPKLDNEILPFVEIASALKDYVSVRNASPTAKEMESDSMDFNILRMDRIVNNPIDKFNIIVRNTNFRCDDYQKMFESAAKVSCDVVNVEAMEHFRVAIFGCLSLASLLYLFYWRRADNSQYWNDPRVQFAHKFMTNHMDDEQHKEWKTIDFKNPEGATYDHFVKNKKKNRYVDIPLIDQSRVILENHKSDYIHASWIEVPGTERKYIATQAPMKSTYNDFWHMLLQENVKIVVMLTGFIEMDLNYCDFYFPGEVGEVKKYGQVEVTCLSVKDSPPEARLVLTVKRVFQLRDLRNPDAPPQFVTHLHFQNWFAEVVPRFLCRVLYFLRYMDSLVVDDTPIVVLCNSGTERTGVLIAVDYAHELVIQNRFVSMKALAEDLGKLRWGVLDSFIPYLFITASLTTRFIYENYLFEDDWFVAYGKYSATKNNRLGKQDKMRRKKGVQVHYWKTFEVPDYYKPRIRRRSVFRNLSDISSENSSEE